MSTLTAQEYDGERIYETRELPTFAKVQIHYVRKEEGKESVEGDCVAVFQHMDGMYGLRKDEKTGEPLIFNGRFKHIDGDCFILVKE